ncbi:hypothetical protein F2P56_033082 [Juglans regia]|uniref:Uncharacterized protein n=1 Tax=Juglans regia TaxID=51240 RepID=A0A833WVG3_JUGRE|nr:hypothetical protein F2P56_033082 [Juglans regia]
MTMSRRYLSSSMEAMNLDRRSFRSEKPIFRRWFFISVARIFTVLMASFSFLSEPTLSSLLIFHTIGEIAIARSADSLEATSKATAKLDIGSDNWRLPGSNPKENLQMLSKEKRRNTSCRSKTPSRLPATDKKRGISLDWISEETISNA